MTELTLHDIKQYLDRAIKETETSAQTLAPCVGIVSANGFEFLLEKGYITETGEITELGLRQIGLALMADLVL